MTSATTLRLSSALIALAAVSPALAQTAEPDSSLAFDEIVVTAQFRAQNLQDTPIAITAVTGATLAARSQISIIDVASFAPNVNIQPAPTFLGSSINAYIRGVGQNDSSAAFEPGVGVYIDDIYYGATLGAVFDLTDLDRVEVLRGPQGTLSGKNSIGGSLKLFSKKPGPETDGYIEATGGSFDRIDLRAGASFTLADGFYARVSGVSKHRDGFVKRLDYGCVNPGSGIPATPASGGTSCVIGTEGGTDLDGVRVALRYAPDGSPLEINLVGDFTDDRSEPAPQKLLTANFPDVRSYDASNPFAGIPFDNRFLTGPKDYTNYGTYVNGGNYTTVFGGFPFQVVPGTFVAKPINGVEAYGLAGTIDYQINDWLSLKSITGYRKATATGGVDIDASPLDVILQSNTFIHTQFTQELRLSGEIGESVNFTVGGFYYDSDDWLRQRVEIPNVMFDFLTNDPVNTTSKSGFAHLEFRPATDLTFVAGIRYTDDKKRYEFARRNPDGSIPSGAPLTLNWLVAELNGVSDTFTGDRWDYRLGVNYRWNDNLMTYVQVATGFKGGGVNPRPYTAIQVRSFAPETLTSFEGGFKSDFLDRRVRLNGALFFNKYKDIQLTFYACPESPCSLPQNGGDADMWGGELELTVRPMDALTVEGSLGYLDFDFTQVNPASFVSLDDIAPFVSKWQASASVEYRAELGNGGSIAPRFDIAYRARFFHNPINLDLAGQGDNSIDAHTIANARLTYRTADEDWSVSAAVTNLFDKFYYVGKGENIASYGQAFGILGRPREWSITVKRAF